MAPKIIKFAFQVDQGVGEIPFRMFHSSKQVNEKVFAVVSKLTKDNLVEYQILGVDGRGPKVLRQTKSVMDDFYKDLRKLETTLQTIDPSVKMLENHGDGMALTNHELADGVKMNKAVAQDILNELEKKPTMEEFFNQPPTSNRLRKYM